MTIGFAICGSFCTYSKILPIIESLTQEHNIIPILSFTSAKSDNRFVFSKDFLTKIEKICKNSAIQTIETAEPIGPKKLLDVLVIAPCTGNTISKLSHGIADTPVTMAAKSHLRNNRPVVVAVSTNDGLAGAAENIGRLLNRKNFYFVPFAQDDAQNKPSSLVADFRRIPDTISFAVSGKQIQPILL